MRVPPSTIAVLPSTSRCPAPRKPPLRSVLPAIRAIRGPTSVEHCQEDLLGAPFPLVPEGWRSPFRSLICIRGKVSLFRYGDTITAGVRPLRFGSDCTSTSRLKTAAGHRMADEQNGLPARVLGLRPQAGRRASIATSTTAGRAGEDSWPDALLWYVLRDVMSASRKLAQGTAQSYMHRGQEILALCSGGHPGLVTAGKATSGRGSAPRVVRHAGWTFLHYVLGLGRLSAALGDIASRLGWCIRGPELSCLSA
ncbi:hypothetical protein V8D89_002185 [Ganoderma adspersum]